MCVPIITTYHRAQRLLGQVFCVYGFLYVSDCAFPRCSYTLHSSSALMPPGFLYAPGSVSPLPGLHHGWLCHTRGRRSRRGTSSLSQLHQIVLDVIFLRGRCKNVTSVPPGSYQYKTKPPVDVIETVVESHAHFFSNCFSNSLSFFLSLSLSRSSFPSPCE